MEIRSFGLCCFYRDLLKGRTWDFLRWPRLALSLIYILFSFLPILSTELTVTFWIIYLRRRREKYMHEQIFNLNHHGNFGFYLYSYYSTRYLATSRLFRIPSMQSSLLLHLFPTIGWQMHIDVSVGLKMLVLQRGNISKCIVYVYEWTTAMSEAS